MIGSRFSHDPDRTINHERVIVHDKRKKCRIFYCLRYQHWPVFSLRLVVKLNSYNLFPMSRRTSWKWLERSSGCTNNAVPILRSMTVTKTTMKSVEVDFRIKSVLQESNWPTRLVEMAPNVLDYGTIPLVASNYHKQ